MSKKEDRLDLYREVEKQLKYPRFIHTMGVTFTAASLAAKYGVDVQKAEMAGLLHDCAKHMDTDDMEKLCEKAGIGVSAIERGKGSLLHAKAGSVLAKTKYGVLDEEILQAIRYHTTGRPAMTQLEKIIFIADYIEPGRLNNDWQEKSQPNLKEIQAAAFHHLDDALRMILADTLEYLHSDGKEIDPMTQMTYDYYTGRDKEG